MKKIGLLFIVQTLMILEGYTRNLDCKVDLNKRTIYSVVIPMNGPDGKDFTKIIDFKNNILKSGETVANTVKFEVDYAGFRSKTFKHALAKLTIHQTRQTKPAGLSYHDMVSKWITSNFQQPYVFGIVNGPIVRCNWE